MVLSPFHLTMGSALIVPLSTDYSIDKIHGFMEKSSFLFACPAAVRADGALTRVAAKVRHAGDLLTEKNCRNPSKPEYFRLHRNRENMRKKPRHPKMTSLF